MTIPPDRLRACEETLQAVLGDVSVLDDQPRLKALLSAVHKAGRRRGRAVKRAAAPPVPAVLRRSCYVCKRRTADRDAANPALCRACGAVTADRRRGAADLYGRSAVVTGGRVRIGFATALRLLRAGAKVAVTTRFPRDAARRYAREPDFAAWSDRLTVHGLDLRHLGDAERFADARVARGPLDVLVNNAAQTVRRPPGYHRALVAAEASAALPAGVAALLADGPEPRRLAGPAALPSAEEAGTSLLAEVTDEDGGLLDLRTENSWTSRLAEVPTVEWLEAQVINLTAPALLLRRLRPALDASPHARRFVVNVTSEEGRFARPSDAATHPHTNAAKAGLNMLTRTLAADWARDGVYVCGVDPGWVSDQRPAPLAAADPLTAPVTLEDAAARVLDPVWTGLSDPAEPPHGVLLKDFQPVPW